MSWSFDSLIAFGAAHPHAIGALAFLAALLESLAIVGVVFPGSIALIALGALVPTGAIGVMPLLACAIAGAIVGDGLSYWLGRRYHEQIRLWRPFRHCRGGRRAAGMAAGLASHRLLARCDRALGHVHQRHEGPTSHAAPKGGPL
jgi:membrane protein DedA with SNARE-associated domain